LVLVSDASETEHILREKPGRVGDEEITVKSVSLPAEGVSVAAAASYEGALTSGVGREI